MNQRINPFDVKVDGVPIKQVPVRNGVNTGVTYSMEFQEWEAATEANLNLWDWYCGLYSNLFKAKVVAWYQNHREIQTHVQDKVNRQTRK